MLFTSYVSGHNVMPDLSAFFPSLSRSTLKVATGSVLLCSGSAGYCFVELADEASVERCVQRLNGKLVPGSNPVSSVVQLIFTHIYYSSLLFHHKYKNIVDM